MTSFDRTRASAQSVASASFGNAESVRARSEQMAAQMRQHTDRMERMNQLAYGRASALASETAETQRRAAIGAADAQNEATQKLAQLAFNLGNKAAMTGLRIANAEQDAQRAEMKIEIQKQEQLGYAAGQAGIEPPADAGRAYLEAYQRGKTITETQRAGARKLKADGLEAFNAGETGSPMKPGWSEHQIDSYLQGSAERAARAFYTGKIVPALESLEPGQNPTDVVHSMAAQAADELSVEQGEHHRAWREYFLRGALTGSREAVEITRANHLKSQQLEQYRGQQVNFLQSVEAGEIVNAADFEHKMQMVVDAYPSMDKGSARGAALSALMAHAQARGYAGRVNTLLHMKQRGADGEEIPSFADRYPEAAQKFAIAAQDELKKTVTLRASEAAGVIRQLAAKVNMSHYVPEHHNAVKAAIAGYAMQFKDLGTQDSFRSAYTQLEKIATKMVEMKKDSDAYEAAIQSGGGMTTLSTLEEWKPYATEKFRQIQQRAIQAAQAGDQSLMAQVNAETAQFFMDHDGWAPPAIGAAIKGTLQIDMSSLSGDDRKAAMNQQVAQLSPILAAMQSSGRHDAVIENVAGEDPGMQFLLRQVYNHFESSGSAYEALQIAHSMANHRERVQLAARNNEQTFTKVMRGFSEENQSRMGLLNAIDPDMTPAVRDRVWRGMLDASVLMDAVNRPVEEVEKMIIQQGKDVLAALGTEVPVGRSGSEKVFMLNREMADALAIGFDGTPGVELMRQQLAEFSKLGSGIEGEATSPAEARRKAFAYQRELSVATDNQTARDGSFLVTEYGMPVQAPTDLTDDQLASVGMYRTEDMFGNQQLRYRFDRKKMVLQTKSERAGAVDELERELQQKIDGVVDLKGSAGGDTLGDLWDAQRNRALNDTFADVLSTLRDEGLVPPSLGGAKPFPQFNTLADAFAGTTKEIEDNMMNRNGGIPVNPRSAKVEDTYQFRRRQILVESEGDLSTVYKDHKGIPTVGVGINLHDAVNYNFLKGMGIEPEDVIEGRRVLSKKERDLLFENAVHEAEKIVSTKIKRPLTENQRLALVSLAFNNPNLIGPNLTRYVNEGNWTAAEREIRQFSNRNRHSGIQNRRNREADLFAIDTHEPAKPVFVT